MFNCCFPLHFKTFLQLYILLIYNIIVIKKTMSLFCYNDAAENIKMIKIIFLKSRLTFY